jgi:hypothetical protein
MDLNKSKPSQKELDSISKKAGDNWRSLLTNLGVDLDVIRTHLQSNQGITKNACFEVLVLWQKGNVPSEDPVSYETLCKALRESDLSSCAAELEEKLLARLPPKSPLTEEVQEEAGVSGPATHVPSLSPPATQGEASPTTNIGDERSLKIREIVGIYRNVEVEGICLPRIPHLEDDLDDILVDLKFELLNADPATIIRLQSGIQMKYRTYINGVRSVPLPDVPCTAAELHDFIAAKSTPYEIVLLHHTLKILGCKNLKDRLGEYERSLAKHMEEKLTSWKRSNISLPSRENHTHLAVIVSQKPEYVLFSLVFHIKDYLVELLHLDEALFEGFAEDCTILFFSILTSDAVLLAPSIISHLGELRRLFHVTHLIVFGLLACDLEQATVEFPRTPFPQFVQTNEGHSKKGISKSRQLFGHRLNEMFKDCKRELFSSVIKSNVMDAASNDMMKIYSKVLKHGVEGSTRKKDNVHLPHGANPLESYEEIDPKIWEIKDNCILPDSEYDRPHESNRPPENQCNNVKSRD